MMKLFLFFYALFAIVKFIGNAIGNLIHRFAKAKSNTTQINRDWYGICDNCGKKDGLHRLDGKRYCAMCYARISTEKKFAAKQEMK